MDTSNRLGQQVGNYRLEKLLGSGGFADVYLGKQVYLDSFAAIKLLHTNLTPEEIEAFRLEARTLVRLIHPHIIRILDFGLEGNAPFLIMDYALHGTLRQRHPRGEKLPLATVVEYVKQIASALQYAHDGKVIHRDIKPENMLLGGQNEILIADFGIATVVQNTHTQLTQEMTGTVAYMAPEQIQGHPRPASDQYSLGVVVYEWLSGSPPFTGAFAEVAVQHVMTVPQPLRQRVPSLLPEVEQVISTAVAKDPTRRFGSIRAFANALEQASKSAPVVFPVQLPDDPVSLTMPTTPVAEISNPVRMVRDLPAAAVEAFHVITPVTPYPQAFSAETEQSLPFVPYAPIYNPVTPPPQIPIQYWPEAPQKKRSRRGVLIAGLAIVGVAAAGGGAWALLSHRPSGTTSGTGTTKTITPTPRQQTPTATAIPGLVAQDTFNRPNQLFWGTASDGLAWDGDANKANDFAISAGTGQIYRTATGKSLYTAVLGKTHTDVEVIATALLDQFNPSHIGVIVRYTDDNNYYKILVDGSELNLLRRLGGNNTTLQSIPYTAQAKTPYTIRFQVIGTTLRGMIWQTGQAEPTDWLFTVTDSTFQSGLGGLRPQVDQFVTFHAMMFQETIIS